MATVIELSDSDDDKPSQTASISKPGLSKAATSNTPKRSNSSSSTEQAKSKAKNPFSYGFTPILPEDEVLLDDDEVGSSSSATAKNNSNGNAQTSNASKPEQSRKRKQPDSPVVANPKKKQKSAAPRSLGTSSKIVELSSDSESEAEAEPPAVTQAEIQAMLNSAEFASLNAELLKGKAARQELSKTLSNPNSVPADYQEVKLPAFVPAQPKEGKAAKPVHDLSEEPEIEEGKPEQQSPKQEQPAQDAISLKMIAPKWEKKFKVLRSTTTFDELRGWFFKQTSQWPNLKDVIFKVDGEAVKPKQTAEDLDLEDDMQVDVTFVF